MTMAEESPPSPPPSQEKVSSGLFAGLNMTPSADGERTPKQSNKAVLETFDPPPTPPELKESSEAGRDDNEVLKMTSAVKKLTGSDDTASNEQNGSDLGVFVEAVGAESVNTTPDDAKPDTNGVQEINGVNLKDAGGSENETSSEGAPDAATASEVLQNALAEDQTSSPVLTEDTQKPADKNDDDQLLGPAVAKESEIPSGAVASTEEEGASLTDDSPKSPSVEETVVEKASERKELNAKDQQALEEAFAESSSERSNRSKRGRPRGLGKVHPDTPIPHADVALGILRKFAAKTRPDIGALYGGTKSRGIWGYLFGSTKEDPTFVPYRDLMEELLDGDEDEEAAEPVADSALDQIAGHEGDSMARARNCMAKFVYLFSQWGHASSRLLEAPTKTKVWFADLLSIILDTATQLVAHGCWDEVQIGIGEKESEMEYHPAVHMLAQSVLNADLTMETNELAAMKFMLTTGCRRADSTGQALLRGSHLLQTIRVLYHIYLTTESMPNKTTARAALQQLVTSVFTRVVQQKDFGRTASPTKDHFPSESHRDAFLALRSLCKLSMRNLPDGGLQAHVGLQTSGSYETWDEKETNGMLDRSENNESTQKETAQLVYTSAIHPALESKILALELLLYILQNIEFGKEFIWKAGPQFHAAIRNYLCVSLLKNCLSDNTRVVNLSLRIFVPLMGSFRIILKNEIEAFVTNVFFVILDSPNSPVEHKSLVVNTFDEICSDPSTLAEIFLNYDCDLSAVDLFHRIVNTLSRMARAGAQEPKTSSISFMGGRDAARMEKSRNDNRQLRLNAMKALRQVLASLHASIVEPMSKVEDYATVTEASEDEKSMESMPSSPGKNLVEIYDSKKKRRAEESEVVIRFNQKPSAGLAYAAECEHIDPKDPAVVAGYLLKNKDIFEKTQIGEYLGREAEYQGGFSIEVLHNYVRLMDFTGLQFDNAIRFFLSGFRLPGEAQKIDRIMEKFAERFTDQNPEVFPSADVAFILSFSIIMLNTDLHNPAIKEERRMTKEGFVRNNRGISDGQDLPEDLLTGIFDRIQQDPISLKEDDEARERVGGSANGSSIVGAAALNPASFFKSHYEDMDRARETNFQKERDHIVRTTETLLKRRKHTSNDGGKTQTKQRKSSNKVSKFVRTEDTGLRDEYVSPMFEVTWGPALAAFSTAMESANGTVGSLVAIASDEELELAAENAAETIEVCLTGFRFAIGIAGLCGNDIARDSYMLALSRFTQLGTGVFLEPRHVRCIQTMLSLAREDGELLGASWQHVFRALSEINRFHQLFHLMARNDRAAAAAADRRRLRMEEKENRRVQREQRRIAAEEAESIGGDTTDDEYDASEIDSLAESELFSDDESFGFEEEMDAKALDEVNARLVYEAVSEAWIEAIYERSSSLSAPAVKEFVAQLCFVSNSEISVGSGVSGGDPNDLNKVAYRQQHALLSSSSGAGDQFHHSQPNIYNLQKLVEVAHYNMDSRPRLIFAEIWATVAEHLTMTALHANPALAMYAVDSFRQLSIQYLKRDELEVFEFQKRFLKPLETVMAKSDQESTKELLLDCISRVVQVFDIEPSKSSRKGGLRSGWVPILQILGLGGFDKSLTISTLSFKITKREIEHSLQRSTGDSVLLNEHFGEIVNALFMFVAGPHEEMSINAISQVLSLAAFLGDPSAPLPLVKRRSTTGHGVSRQDHELWWPLLLGLSRSVGDDRVNVRSEGLKALFSIVAEHFLPTSPSPQDDDDTEQTMQLIFRGILSPILEFAEVESEEGKSPGPPDDFERCNLVEKGDDNDSTHGSLHQGWLETVFEKFMDYSIALCRKSMTSLGSDLLTEEIFAILNSCLMSDSGAMAVRGLKRLEQFVVSDLEPADITENAWATVSHMLRRSLSVRGLPSKPPPNGVVSDQSQAEFSEDLQEFIMEDRLLSDRRFVAPNAIMVIGQLLSTERFSNAMGLSWQLFLIEGLGDGIVEWDRAAILLQDTKNGKRIDRPGYHEIALYGRKWMNRFLLKLASLPAVASATPEETNGDASLNDTAQKIVLKETNRLLTSFVDAEKEYVESRTPTVESIILGRLSNLVTELLAGYNSMDADHLKNMSWINPVLLEAGIRSKDESIRSSIQKLVRRTSNASETPYPAPESPVAAAATKPENSEQPSSVTTTSPEEDPEQPAVSEDQAEAEPTSLATPAPPQDDPEQPTASEDEDESADRSSPADEGTV